MPEICDAIVLILIIHIQPYAYASRANKLFCLASKMINQPHASVESDDECLNAAQYLGHRLVQLGCRHVFIVPGDYSLPVLDGMATVPGIQLVSTANELDAAYAAGKQGCCPCT